VAVVLNVSADHMDRYSGIEDYADTKAGVYQGAEWRLFNRDDPRVMAMRGEPANDLLFTLGEPKGDDCFGLCMDGNEAWLCRGQRKLLAAAEVRMPGRHNLANALAALAMGSALGFDEGAMLEVLRSYRGLPHRTEFVAEHEGVCWYNDSKGTNVGAVIAALEGLVDEKGGRTVLIAGGECKDGDFSQLASVVAERVRALVLIGRDAPELERCLAGSAPLYLAADMSEAVEIAGREAQPGDRVLLSPGCASFDMFDNYEHRGRVFTQAVERWLQ
jgi:UDP-N-acetylmuramoylalanine--D-glutamate ligase